MTTLAQIQLRGDTSSNWTSANPILALSELGYEDNTGKFKIGDGATGWNSLPYNNSGGALVPNGTYSSPMLVTTAGVTVLGVQREIQFIAGNGGPITVSGSPAISAGTVLGQELTLVSTNNLNTVTFNDGGGLSLNGSIVMGAPPSSAGSVLSLIWNGTLWYEVSRR